MRAHALSPVLRAFAAFPRRSAAGESSKEMVIMSFGMIVAVFTEYFEHATSAFVDFVSCLVEFAFNRVAEEIALGAIHLLQSCAAQLTTAAAIPSEAATLPSVETPLPDSIPEGVSSDGGAAVPAAGDLSVPPAIVPVAGAAHVIAPPSAGGDSAAAAAPGAPVAAPAAAAVAAAAAAATSSAGAGSRSSVTFG